MSQLQTRLDALQTALARGERRVSFGDKTVEYRTVDELAAAIREVKRALFEESVANGTAPGAPRQIRLMTSKGA